MSPPHFLHLRAVGIIAGIILLFVSLNLVVDPYDLRARDAFLKLPLRSRQSIPRNEYVHKAYALFYQRPETVYFGNSRVSIGLPTDDELWKSRTYNCGLTAAQPEEMLAYLRHALLVGGVKRVVLGFDAVTFLGPHCPPSIFNERVLLSEARSKMRPAFTLPTFYSLGTVADSLKTLLRQVGTNVVVYREGVHDEDEMRAEIKGNSTEASQQILDVARRELHDLAALDPKTDFLRMECARKMAALCRWHQVEVIVVFLPNHHTFDELLEAEGLSGRVQAVQAEVRRTFEDAGIPSLAIHDFSRDQKHTLDSQAESEGGKVWKWWWEVSHFRAVFGREIVHQMAASPQHP